MYIVHANKFRSWQARTTSRSERVSKVEKPVEYTAPSGVKRIRVLHPTKGWRDRNVDNISRSFTGLKAGDVMLRRGASK